MSCFGDVMVEIDSKWIKKLLRELSKERPIFHSEDDFKHALAWKIHKKLKLKSSEIILEKKCHIKSINKNEKDMYIDIFFIYKKRKYAIELKYKTKSLKNNESRNISNNEKEPLLKNQGAYPLGRYSFWRDVYRLEQLKNNDDIDKGFAIFLTNDRLYWEEPRKETIDYAFRIHERKVGKRLVWNIPKTKKRKGWLKKLENISLRNNYDLTWKNFQPWEENNGKSKNTRFRFLILEIPPS